MDEKLKCGPCNKCKKRATEMQSSLLSQLGGQTRDTTHAYMTGINRSKVEQNPDEDTHNSMEYTESGKTKTKMKTSLLSKSSAYMYGCMLALGILTFITDIWCKEFTGTGNMKCTTVACGEVITRMYAICKQVLWQVFVTGAYHQWVTGTCYVGCITVACREFKVRVTAGCWQVLRAAASVCIGIYSTLHGKGKRLKEFIGDPVSKLGRGSAKCCTVTTRSNVGIQEKYVPWAQEMNHVEMREAQLKDPDLKPLINWIGSNERPTGKESSSSSHATRHLLIGWDDLVMEQGVLLRKFNKRDGTGSFLQFVTPRSMQKEVLHQMHNSVMSGHLGKKKTREKLLQRYYWFGVRDSVNNWIAQCDTCGANKPPPSNPRAPLGSMQVGGTFDRLGTDIIGPLPVTKRNNRYILVCTDAFTKWCEIFAIPDITAETTARVILNEVIWRYGTPITIHSDQGSNYQSKPFTELCELLEVRKTRTSVRNPKCNGQTERLNKTLVRMIRAYLKDQSEWDLNLGCLASAYRSTPHQSTGVTPNLLMFGREVRLPAEIVFGSETVRKNEVVSSYGAYVEQLKSTMQHAHDVARKNLNACAKRQKEIYDHNARFSKFDTGDLVWYLQATRKESVNPKLVFPYAGPFIVKQRLSDQNYMIQFNADGLTKVIHHDKLKLYKGRNPPKWIAKLQ